MKSERNSRLQKIAVAALAIGALLPVAVHAQGTMFISGPNVGIGIAAPTQDLHVFGADGATQVLVEDTDLTPPSETVMFRLRASTKIRFSLNNTAVPRVWTFDNDGNFTISDAGDGVNEVVVDPAGNMTILGTLTQGSDIQSKTALEPVSNMEILQQVAGMPITEWSYKETPQVRHIGPSAQDFHAAFGLGATDKGIGAVDADGVALASIQALYQLVREQQREIEKLRGRLEELTPRE